MHFSPPRHRHSPCLGTFSRISGHFVIAPSPSPSTSFSVLPRPLLLLLHPRLLLLPPSPFLPFPPPASPPSTSGDDSSCCCPRSSSSFLPTPLPLIPYDQTTTTATNNHLVPLRCRERRCCCACRLIFGRTFRFGVLYWTVQKWHLPVSELTSCQVSVSFARAVPGRWRVYASA